MLKILLVTFCFLQATLSSDVLQDTQGKFVYCECPDVEMDPDLQLDSRTACPHANSLAAEMTVSNVGGHLVFTSLNLDLAEVEKYLQNRAADQRQHPVLVLADVVRIKERIRLNQVDIVARKVRGYPELSRIEGQYRIYADEVDGIPSNTRLYSSKDFTPSEKWPIYSAFNQWLDQLEYVLRLSPSTFDYSHGVCPGMLQPAQERDLFSRQFQFAEKLMTSQENMDFKQQLNRLRLLRKYRGPILEGGYLDNIEASDFDELYNQLEQTIQTLEAAVKETEKEQLRKWSKFQTSPTYNGIQGQVEHINELLEITSQLLGLTKITSNDVITSRFSIVSKAKSAMEIYNEITNKDERFPIDNQVLENPHEKWPKEFDFAEVKQSISSLSGQNVIPQDVSFEWIRIVTGLETLYHLRNLEAAVRLDFTLAQLALFNTKSAKHRRAVNNLLLTNTKQARSVEETTLIASIEMKDIPTHLFNAGLIEKQIWPSQPEFANFAQLRVNNIRAHINGDDMSNVEIYTDNKFYYDVERGNGSKVIKSGFPVSFPSSRKSGTVVSPFTRWQIRPNDAAKHISGDLVDVTLVFEMTGDRINVVRKDCDPSNAEAFTACKFEGRAPLFALFDGVTAVNLKEINSLIQRKYEKAIKGNDEGVPTQVETGWSPNIASEDCVEIPGVEPFLIKQYVKVSSKLTAPKVLFPRNLETFIALEYQLNNAILLENVETYLCKDPDTLYSNQTTEKKVSGPFKVVAPINLAMAGIKGPDGSVYMDFSNAAVSSSAFENPLISEFVTKSLKQIFIQEFTQPELSTLKSDIATEVFMQPDRFQFQTVCANCVGSAEDEGYILLTLKTKSENSFWLGHPVDPEIIGMYPRATPNEFSSGVFFASHISMCDVFFGSFQPETDQNQLFAVHRSPSPVEAGDQVLNIEYLTDMCMNFSLPELSKSDLTVHVYTKTFKFSSHTKDVRNRLDNTNGSKKDALGDIIGVVLSGITKLCKAAGCDNWFNWFNPVSICKWWALIACWFVELVSAEGRKIVYTEKNWSEGSLHVHKATASPLAFDEQCFNFELAQMTFEPNVDFIFPKTPTTDDNRAAEDMKTRLSAAAVNNLSFRPLKSDSVPLFAALNLVYPGGQVMATSSKSFYTPGPLVMYGNVNNDYTTCEGIELPSSCGVQLPCNGKRGN